MEKKKKALSPDQLDKLKAEYSTEKKPIPPWFKTTNSNTKKDLHRYSVEQCLNATEDALSIENPHHQELLDIRVMLNAWLIGFNDRILNNTRTGANKRRDELEQLWFDTQLRISELETRTGFDLLDRTTWGDTPK